MPRFDPARFLELLERHRVTVLVGAPPMHEILVHHPLAAAADLSSLELLVCGGAALSPAAQQALAARVPGATVGQAYGLTETCVGVSMPDRASGSVPGTVGRVMAGYLHRPDATAALVDPDGWLGTGDLGLVDAGGNLVIVDRLKELIKVSGFQVAPAELEALLRTHRAVADAIPRTPSGKLLRRALLDQDSQAF